VALLAQIYDLQTFTIGRLPKIITLGEDGSSNIFLLLNPPNDDSATNLPIVRLSYE
jgi:hypothetical protein